MKTNGRMVVFAVVPLVGGAFLLQNLQQSQSKSEANEQAAAQPIPTLRPKHAGARKPRPTPIATATAEPMDREFAAPLRISGQAMAFAGGRRYLVQNSNWVGELIIYNRKTRKSRSQHYKNNNEIGRDGADTLVPLKGTSLVAGMPDLKFGGNSSIALYDVESEANFSLIARNQTVGGAIAALPSRGQFVVATRDGDLCFYNAKSGKVARRWKNFTARQTGNSKADTKRYAPAVIAVSPDEKRIATAGVYLDVSNEKYSSSTLLDKSIVVWDEKTGVQILSFEKPGYPPNSNGDWSRIEMTSLAWSPDGKWLATDSRGNGVVIWNAVTGKVHKMLSHPMNRTGNRIIHMYNGAGVLFSPDSQSALAPGDYGTIDVYNVSSGELTRQIKGGGPMAFAPGTKELFYQFPRDKVATLAFKATEK